MVSVHGEAVDLEGDKIRGDDTAMQAVQPDARFLRSILFTLIICTLAVGAAAGMAALHSGKDARQVVTAER
jgi:hypothetical protein